jgi:hypothetical protein
MENPNGPTVFISYSHRDHKWFHVLETHLRTLVAQGFLRVWSDQEIRSGEKWHTKILHAISEASITILLISADYLTSEFVKCEEIPRLLQRRLKDGMIIIPVICRPCPWTQVPWLTSMQVRPRNGRALSIGSFPHAETEFASIAEEVIEVLRESEALR